MTSRHDPTRARRLKVTAATAAVLLLTLSCSDAEESGDPTAGTGGAATSGGTGGAASTGGASTGGTSSGGTSSGGTSSTGSGGSIDFGEGEPAELTGITQLHNDARADVGAPPLRWDPALATIAADWASSCTDADNDDVLDHNPDRADGYPGSVGENIYLSSGTVATAESAVKLWLQEEQDYDYATNSCSSICGHYTQLVWSDSTKLGCAVANCPKLRFPSVLVCNYSPAGNYAGERPY